MTTTKHDIGDGPREGDDDRDGGQPVAPLEDGRRLAFDDMHPGMHIVVVMEWGDHERHRVRLTTRTEEGRLRGVAVDGEPWLIGRGDLASNFSCFEDLESWPSAPPPTPEEAPPTGGPGDDAALMASWLARAIVDRLRSTRPNIVARELEASGGFWDVDVLWCLSRAHLSLAPERATPTPPTEAPPRPDGDECEDVWHCTFTGAEDCPTCDDSVHDVVDGRAEAEAAVNERHARLAAERAHASALAEVEALRARVAHLENVEPPRAAPSPGSGGPGRSPIAESAAEMADLCSMDRDDLIDEVTTARAEVARLRSALIEAGRAAGAGLADSISTEFLMHVPEEVRLVMGRLRSELEEARRTNERLDRRLALAETEEAALRVRLGEVEARLAARGNDELYRALTSASSVLIRDAGDCVTDDEAEMRTRLGRALLRGAEALTAERAARERAEAAAKYATDRAEESIGERRRLEAEVRLYRRAISDVLGEDVDRHEPEVGLPACSDRQAVDLLREYFSEVETRAEQAEARAVEAEARAAKAEGDEEQALCETAGYRRRDARIAELENALRGLLSSFVHPGHPGRPCLRSGWEPVEVIERLRALVSAPSPTKGAPLGDDGGIEERRVREAVAALADAKADEHVAIADRVMPYRMAAERNLGAADALTNFARRLRSPAPLPTIETEGAARPGGKGGV